MGPVKPAFVRERGKTMATVSTVLGPVDASELGFTLSHEHLATGSAGMRQLLLSHYEEGPT